MPVLETPPSWDLSDLYAGLEDPRIDQDMRQIRERAERFETEYRDKIESSECTASLLRKALDEYEELNRKRALPLSFASLMFSADTTDPKRGALLQRMREESTAISRHLIFFDLEIGRMPEPTFTALLEDEALAQYRHYLEYERRRARHYLSEAEEKIVAELANTGSRALERLSSEVNARSTYQVRVGGEVQTLNQSDTLALLYHPSREVRRAASEAFTTTLKEMSHVLTFIFNTLLQEKATMDRLRGYSYPAEEQHEENELDPAVVEKVVEVCVDSYDIVAEYYRLKARLLGIDRLTHYDRYAPMQETATEIPYSEARDIVLSAFGRFSGELHDTVKPFFERGWIDAETRNGKRGGAFCSYITPDKHPFVFMNYKNLTRDVMTLAHELGHAAHGVLAKRNNYLEFHPSLPLAETASVFGEMLVFESLQERLEDPKERLALLAGKIEDTFATVFRQATMYRFEEQAHAARRSEGELTTERYNEIWQSTLQEMFGDSLVLEEDHAWWWLYIPHFVNTPFYVYAYAFGELLVLALYARYRQEGEPFVRQYLELLAAGGSGSPTQILSRLGIDIARKEFWQGGIDLIRDMVERAKSLADGAGVSGSSDSPTSPLAHSQPV
jgi:oligoendopeptidase F